MNDFKGDLQTILYKTGVKGDGVIFQFTDNMIFDERCLVAINDLLSSGQVADLYSKDELDAVTNGVASKAKAAGMAEKPFAFFVDQVRTNLHMVLCFSPVGEGFRTRARKFPALVGCTVLDWFQPWPADALHSVGQRFLREMFFPNPLVQVTIEAFMPHSFVSMQGMCKTFKREQGRLVYTTPKTYLELLSTYSALLRKKEEENEAATNRLVNGIALLEESDAAVTVLKRDLAVMLTEAEEKAAVATEIAKTVSGERAIVEVETEKANVEAGKVAEIQADVQVKAESAEADLAKAEPAVAAAMAALDTLDKKDLGSCKTMSTPPSGVGDVFAAVMVLLAGIHPKIKTNKAGKVKDADRGWDGVKKVSV
jgi:dynein heavy chain